jgi:hypothetical protein
MSANPQAITGSSDVWGYVSLVNLTLQPLALLGTILELPFSLYAQTTLAIKK